MACNCMCSRFGNCVANQNWIRTSARSKHPRATDVVAVLQRRAIVSIDGVSSSTTTVLTECNATTVVGNRGHNHVLTYPLQRIMGKGTQL